MSLPRRFVLAAGLAAALAPPALAASAREIDGDVTEALERLTRTNETAANISKKARAVLVFPKIIKAGLVIGGSYGEGALREGGKTAGYYASASASYGLQIGGQESDLVLVVNNRKGVETLVKNQFKLGADASVAAGPVGREAQAATDLQMRAEILSYSRARGVFAGISVSGSTLRQDRDAQQRFYGKPLESRQLLFEGLGGSPGPVGAWKAILQKFAQ